MITSEFKTAVAEKNLLRTRIMLKDSFVIDPTFMQLNELLSYAKINLPDLLVAYDGGYLEEDSSKWSSETMNMELIQLVTNFSDIRINHLKRVVSKVLEREAEVIREKRLSQSVQSNHFTSFDSKKERRKAELKKICSEAEKIESALYEVKENKAWGMKNINELERAAKEILKAVQTYKANR